VVPKWSRCTFQIAALSLALCGCAGSTLELSPEAAAVQVAESKDAVKDCTDLGQVQGSARSLFGDVEAQKLISAKNRAAEKGGNRVVRGGEALADAKIVSGIGADTYAVYRCPK
jgi:hypothetical protein